ncbi:CBS domain-containing protein [Leptolyngbyaceae cyanobacterium CCMR0082]|uniref:CBS domain-containing protein n=2 Tax=Adonisia turfae TaxID=2950184 RepID=A0A6M0SH33_9CYAN|nr:CBS domain-containing protein [Adonisia turfae]NEZ58082.1 CBS domain-containing protein [Adonisia turfae CCMR0081]NEZ67616.1 CBS domain-containing protein [Adonisia turfae CCMR0082]
MMQAKDIMTADVITISGSATVAEAVELMKNKGLRALIVDRRNEDDPYGMVTETDIVYKVAAYGHNPKEMRVFEIMTKPCIVVPPDLGVEYVARLFTNTKIRRAPVVQGRLMGIISVSDILCKSDFVEKPKRLFIEDEIDVARQEARKVCEDQGATSPACAAAWDVVEELQATAAHQRATKKS